MKPENDSSQKGISSSRSLFSGSMLVFGGVVCFCLAGVIKDKTKRWRWPLSWPTAFTEYYLD